MRKRIIGFVLAFVMCLGVMPLFSVDAATSAYVEVRVLVAPSQGGGVSITMPNGVSLTPQIERMTSGHYGFQLHIPHNSEIRLEATPNAGWGVSSWRTTQGETLSTDPVLIRNVGSARVMVIHVRFEPIRAVQTTTPDVPPTDGDDEIIWGDTPVLSEFEFIQLRTEVYPVGSGDVSGDSGRVRNGQVVRFEVTPRAGFRFVEWEVQGHFTIPDEQVLEIEAASHREDFFVRAVFEPISATTSQSAGGATDVRIGHTIQFGGQNWIVLDIEGSHALILRELVIGGRYFHYPYGDITWAESFARQWLNGEFLNSFNADDRARIRETNVVTNNNPWFGTRGGPNTTDHIFLLSIEEVVRYFGDSGRMANQPAAHFSLISDEFNDARQARNSRGRAPIWLLRSPGHSNIAVANVQWDGQIDMRGNANGPAEGESRDVEYRYDTIGFRPAMWISINQTTSQPERPAEPSDTIRVTLNGTPIQFDQPPQNVDGRTLVPLRGIFEAMGATIDWDSATQTVTAARGTTTLTLRIGSNTMVRNGQNITLDVPARLIDGRTFVPVRAIAEGFDAVVVWDADTSTVVIVER